MACSRSVTIDDPLAGLDDVPWAALQCAHGTARDVPDLLRAMQVGLREERRAATSKLCYRVVDEGRQSEAAVFVVPFLAGLALDPNVGDRAGLVAMLAAVAVGWDDHLPDGYDPAEARATLADLRGHHAFWPPGLAEAFDGRPQRLWEAGCAQQVVDAVAAVLSYDAVHAKLPELSTLLTADDPALRAETAHLLAWFPDMADTSVPALTALVADEPSPVVAATAIVALGLLGDPATIPLIRAQLKNDAAVLRWASAIALCRLGASSPDVIDTLTAVIEEPPTNAAVSMPFLWGDYRALALRTLSAVSEGNFAP